MGSIEVSSKLPSSALLGSSCGYLLQELQLIWDEIGEEQFEREKTLQDLEQECLDVYKRQVDSANISRARLHQMLADSEAEFTHLLITLGERALPSRPEKITGALKEQLDMIRPSLYQMQLKKEERVSQFREVLTQIRRISAEIEGDTEADIVSTDINVNESNLSEKKLDEYRFELQRLHKEKNDRLRKVEEYIRLIRNLSAILGMKFSDTIIKVHPSLYISSVKQSKNISDSILAKLDSTVSSLTEEKHMRLEKLIKLGKSLTNLWSLMDTPSEDQQLFTHVTNYKSALASEVSEPGCLALDILNQAEDEVKRLDQLKASKMTELFLKKQLELKDICKRTHMEIPFQTEMDNIQKLINTGEIDHEDLLSSMDEQIAKVKEEALSRKEIMEKVEKWIVSCEEESWLEEYMRDENRYSVSRGAHKNLKRAERARITVGRIPGLVESLMARTKAWEEERKKGFFYDKVSLCAMLEEYNLSRKEKEEEKLRQREKKKMQGQIALEQENLFGSVQNASNRRLSGKSFNGNLSNGTPQNKRLSMSIQKLDPNCTSSASQGLSYIKEGRKAQTQKARIRGDTALGLVSLTFSNPSSPRFFH